MKHCKKCDSVKPLSEFNKNRAKADGVQAQCRDCSKIYNNRGYIENPNRAAAIKATRERNRAYNRKLMRRLKSRFGCRLCGENEPVALDLHHADPSAKEETVANLLTGSTKRLKTEIRKCVVLCSNCHRKLHAGLLQI